MIDPTQAGPGEGPEENVVSRPDASQVEVSPYGSANPQASPAPGSEALPESPSGAAASEDWTEDALASDEAFAGSDAPEGESEAFSQEDHEEEDHEESEPNWWAEVPEPLQRALLDQEYDTLTAVQEAAVQALSEGRDLRITSQTGSGKTVALGLAMAPTLIEAAGVKRSPKRTLGPVGLVIAPTRELAGQVQRELMWLYKHVKNLRVECVTGGTPIGPEAKRLGTSPLVLVGTPGRLLDHVRRGGLDLSLVEQLVLDEADQMLDLGFRDELDAILEGTPAGRHTHLVSATFPKPIQDLAERYQANAYHVEGTRLGAANADIEHVGYWVNRVTRYGVLVNQLLMAGDERALIFVATRRDTAMLADQLSNDGFAAAGLSGDLQQKQRDRTLAAFRSGAVRILVATDVAARGLDVPDVPLVIQGEPPRDGEVYVHRSGRTGRAGKKGTCVILGPSNGKRRVQRMLQDAGIDVRWRDVPTAEQVREVQQARSSQRVRTQLETAAEATETNRALARELLVDRDPEVVVAQLLAQLPGQGPVEPFQVQNVATKKSKKDRFEREERDYPRKESFQPRRDDSSFGSKFAINWGRQQGANAGRILALICRRGGIQSSEVGAIRLGPSSSTFEIADHVASGFADKARQFDPRDPGIRIRPAGKGSGGHGNRGSDDRYDEGGDRGGYARRRGGFGRGRGGRGGRGGPRRGSYGQGRGSYGQDRYESRDRDGGYDSRGGRDHRDDRGGYAPRRGGFGGGRGRGRSDGGRSARYHSQDTPPPRHPDERSPDSYESQSPSVYGRPRGGGGYGGGRGGPRRGGRFRRGGGRRRR